MRLLTVVVPCYNEEAALPIFYDEMSRTMEEFKNTDSELEFELLFIDDGSKDNTLQIIKSLKAKDDRVRYVSFSRNFGKEAGIYAGLDNANGDYVVIMDADLQDPPSLLPEMYKAVSEEGYDTAATRRVTRKG
ncbi:MAG: glycosyltransferase family 2 protein, partial [Lachnospiraceae bacterium]|nr:glycosyltransferase family 2 protein [Lachnospiraceae bacterium]